MRERRSRWTGSGSRKKTISYPAFWGQHTDKTMAPVNAGLGNGFLTDMLFSFPTAARKRSLMRPGRKMNVWKEWLTVWSACHSRLST